ncbi:hypothetical protein M3Y96_00330700 [Aphelenchoides besseyi]|nr:hypothetical protein M3Y96_00330700 [Aphelenchoides besseyi]
MRFFCVPLFNCHSALPESLDYSQMRLEEVPKEVYKAQTYLEELQLNMNHIKELPKSLFRLQKLRRLGLSDNDIHRLPPDVAALQNLADLNISRNDISDLPDELKECRQLLVLDISSNPIARLPDSITLVRSLTHLALNDISLTKLPQDIGRLIGLRSLELRENHLRNLPSSITNLVQLQRLDLGQNELDELPVEIGALRSLVEFYLDENSLEHVPDSILLCRVLEQLDLASNRLTSLPDQLGELELLTDLTLSHNCIDSLPNSIGRMKKLNILKVDDNNLTRLTPAIGSCISLTEVFLMQNLLSEIPSTIGNLTNLSNLNLDKNHLTSIPALIGNCSSLTILSLRDNQLEELPLEIGKLSHLRVLDVCNNKLSYLPYTVNVLYELQALWLSENQSQAMLKLQQETDAKTGIRVLTCYLLPQQSANQQDTNTQKPTNKNLEFVGGPKVHFNDSEEAEDGLKVIGNFERKDTPHPKPGVQGQKLKKQHVDGRVIQHEDERRPSVVSLTKKSSSTEIPETVQRPVRNGPKSSLKHPPIYNTPEGSETSYIPRTTSPPPKERNVAFTLPSNSKVAEVEATECRLRRVNTPHYGRQARLAVAQSGNQPASALLTGHLNSTGEAEGSQTSIPANDSNSNFETKRLLIRRDTNNGFGLSIAGGVNSTPYINNDSGLFVSKLTPGAPAERAGLRIGDKLLEVNGTSMVNQRHDVAVQCMQKNPNAVELLDSNRFPPAVASSQRQNNGAVASTSGLNSEIVSTTVVRELNHPLGMSMLHTNEVNPNRSPLRIQYIASGGLIERDGKLRVGDEVISINGINLKGMSFEDALSLLQNSNLDNKPAKELHLVVLRETPIPPVRSDTNRKLQAGELPYGDKSLDGLVEEVELARDQKNSLGISIVGGVDHCSHPFGIDRPGVFVSKISANSPASRSKKLRVGDRILTVNGRNVAKAKHADAVDALKNSGPTLKLGVCHEPQPKGLREVFFTRRSGDAIGSTPANPNDPHDEGIFIERVEAKSAASEATSLRQGVRILEVNEDSLLGCSKVEAAQLLRQTTGRVRLLVCDGFNPTDLEARDEITEFSLGSSSLNLPSFSNSSSTLPQTTPTANNTHESMRGIFYSSATPQPAVDSVPLARSSPVLRPLQETVSSRNGNYPTAVTTFSTNKANEPKPLPAVPKVDANSSFENMNFSSKVRHFENELTLRSGQPFGKPNGRNNNNNNDEIGSNLKLISDSDPNGVRQIKNGSENIPVAVRTIPIKVLDSERSLPSHKYSINETNTREHIIPTVINTSHISNPDSDHGVFKPRTIDSFDPNSATIELKFVDEEK